jgi:predicted dinucleotide-binding enzyme
MRIGIIGAGMIGSTVAKLWVDADHEVLLSSRHPNELDALVKELGPLASAGTPADAAEFGDVVLLTVPLKALPDLAADIGSELAGRTVLDTGNAYEQRDGEIARQAMRHPRGTAGWAAMLFPQSRWVNAFNTVYYKTLASEAHRSGDPVGIPLASDHQQALEVASRLVRDAGFEPVIVGDLGRGKEFEPGTPVYNTGMSAAELRKAFAKPAVATPSSAQSRGESVAEGRG